MENSVKKSIRKGWAFSLFLLQKPYNTYIFIDSKTDKWYNNRVDKLKGGHAVDEALRILEIKITKINLAIKNEGINSEYCKKELECAKVIVNSINFFSDKRLVLSFDNGLAEIIQSEGSVL